MLKELLNQENSLYSLLIILIASVITYLIVKIKNSTQSFKNKRGGKFLVMIVNSSFVSLIILVWLNLFVVRNNFLLKFLGDQILDMIMKIKSISTTWLLWLCLSRFVKQLELSIHNEEIFQSIIKDKHLIQLVSRTLTTVIYIIMGALVMNALGMDISKIITLLGGSAVIIGFGAKSIIEKSLSGLFIRVNKKFEVGDRINLPDKKIVGTVIEIGITTTKILTLDKEIIIIPNEVFQSSSFINCSRADCRCIHFSINVPSRFSSEISSITQNIKTSIEKLDMVQSANVLCDNITEFNIENSDWFIIVKVKAFLKTKDFAIAQNFKSLLIVKAMTIATMMTVEQKDQN